MMGPNTRGGEAPTGQPPGRAHSGLIAKRLAGPKRH